MKLRYVFLTIGLIVLAHLIILIVCFYQPSAGNADNLEKPVTPVQPVPDVNPPAGVPTPSGTGKTAAGTASVPPSTAVRPAARPKTYPALNYRHAWKGNIPELPESAGARNAILVDADTGNVLWDKQATAAAPIGPTATAWI